jgi:hypothetical protein
MALVRSQEREPHAGGLSSVIFDAALDPAVPVQVKIAFY